ncbi:23S rRNA (pseudouridine1915-N3)-methyltransferase [Sporobacter termitidis DSM 10068]|uniref:Ribosomal RNA large subunit methyltransferase H n=1 Tax=Sporobacter termitidis DSM 10068 TaxID=1123282 RepID=A0A1M5UN46_9FIRM|nr:23S rRNA (pseudouridine(1915)-N(3))-methyltransferase RlmH [Sporobacter termitidis]SHH64462.1 23S rRNA (pseudouridine1915-N3)-methyltransferase [Sporobacter termitidis DSM 10068]
MLQIRFICVGKLKEKFYKDAAGEYLKRLSAYCKTELDELPESRLGDRPSPAEIDAALKAEADGILTRLPAGAAAVALCVEGEERDSAGMAALLQKYAANGISKICFVIGGSCGLHRTIKERADVRLSMSRMTFPHHLARIMLLEQVYRAFKIAEGGKYHK